MKIELKEITVRELAEDYADNEELGVVAYSGRLDVRPKYQREFIYKDTQRDAVINTVTRDFPLNVMYWAVQGDEQFEIIDGQQRTISICQYVEGDFAVKVGSVEQLRYFHNLQPDEKQQILDYILMVYLCSGSDSERLDWFRTINIAGEKLTPQELRNAVYSGPWVTDAKRFFSKNGCPAYGIASDYMRGSPIRQEYLETAIDWINDGDIEGYMAKQQNKPNANELWLYFKSVIEWVAVTFPQKRKEMKSVKWGLLFNEFKDEELDPAKLEVELSKLMADEDVTKKSGVYSYVLNRDERSLSIRAFNDNERREAYERQKGICPVCGDPFELEEMQADHITPWSKGGKTISDNCNMLCADDNRRKSGK
ncbi:MAG: HNH endonuclease [Planctomycetota bacterium]|nr:MAG: HNH endonuclease [Planctomycetota bacterium]